MIGTQPLSHSSRRSTARTRAQLAGGGLRAPWLRSRRAQDRGLGRRGPRGRRYDALRASIQPSSATRHLYLRLRYRHTLHLARSGRMAYRARLRVVRIRAADEHTSPLVSHLPRRESSPPRVGVCVSDRRGPTRSRSRSPTTWEQGESGATNWHITGQAWAGSAAFAACSIFAQWSSQNVISPAYRAMLPASVPTTPSNCSRRMSACPA